MGVTLKFRVENSDQSYCCFLFSQIKIRPSVNHPFEWNLGVMTDNLREIQSLQLRFIESASVSESCASDLLTLMQKLTEEEALSVISIISLLQNEAVFLRRISQKIKFLHVA